MHLCRVQPAPVNPLEERFCLSSGGFWGYAFCLRESELYFYQLKAGESPPVHLATPPPTTPPPDLATMLAETPPPLSSQGWNSPSHPQLATLGWQSPDQTPGDSSGSSASLKPKELWALGDPVFRALFREPEENAPQPGESHGQPSTVDDDEAASLLPTAVLELTNLTVKYIINSLIQKHHQDVCQGCEISHPSQRRHSCIFPLEKYNFFQYYDVLCKRFWNGHPTSTLLQSLRLECFAPPPA